VTFTAARHGYFPNWQNLWLGGLVSSVSFVETKYWTSKCSASQSGLYASG